jgi:biopolymer transport protein ExbD
MIWMVTAYLQRANDIRTIADPLRRQLTLITGESGAADARIRRFNQAIREQIDLLRNAQTISQEDLEAIMERVRQHRADLERFESASANQVSEIQDVVRHSMLKMERMMDDKFTMLRVLDDKLQNNGESVARHVEIVREQVSRMLEDVEGASSVLADALDRASRDGKMLAETSRLQEASLTNAAEAAAETLGGLTSKIDLSVAHFLERASSAREEAERLANALDAQTRALDDFSTTLPSRVSEAEAVLRGVADRLYASEQMAREQAVHLTDKLSQHVDGLQGFMDRFTQRLSDIDVSLDRRHFDLTNLAERIGSTTDDFVASWERSITGLRDRTDASLMRFSVANDESRRNADEVAAHLADTTSKYEDVVLRMRALSAEGGEKIRGMTDEIVRNLSQFESLSNASTKAGQEVHERASAAVSNLQILLERLLTAREATQAVGETLVKDIVAAVDQNEKVIARLGEAAQAGAAAVSGATDILGRQQNELAGKARAGEAILSETAQKLQAQAEQAAATLRDKTTALMGLLSETQGQLAATDQRMQSFAQSAVVPVQKAMQQIEISSESGLKSIERLSIGVDAQVARMQEFNARIGSMGEQMGKTAADAAGTFESLHQRFSAIRGEQDISVRDVLAQFTDLSGRLESELGSLDGQSARAVETLREAALKVGEESYQMLEKVRTAGTQIGEIAAALKMDALQIQDSVRAQTESIDSDLARAEQKFAALGESIRERAEAAVISLDRTAAHYNAVTQTTSQELEARAQKIDQTVAFAQSKIEG